MIKKTEEGLSVGALYDIWTQFEAVRADVARHIGTYSGRSAALDQLMEDFRDFCADYFTYFAFLERGKYERETTKAELLSSILSKLSHEWAAIRLAAEQRDPKLYADDLSNADQRAQAYYEAFASAEQGVGMVTYFHKIQDIARFPYSRVPLIGLPLAAAESDAASMAIAHEVGHYVYWRSTDLENHGQVERTLSRAVSNRLLEDHIEAVRRDPSELRRITLITGVWLRWLEECFADLYGCLVAGPFYTLAAQDLFILKIGDSKSLMWDDGEHPIAYLRPMLQSEALMKVAQQHREADHTEAASKLEDVTGLLDERWRTFREKLPGFSEELIHEDTGLPVKEIEARLPLVVDHILNEPVFASGNGREESAPLLQSVELFGRRTTDEVQKLGELITRIQGDLEREAWAVYQHGTRIERPTEEPQYHDVFATLKGFLERKVEKLKKPLWRLLADLQLADVAPHVWYETHTYDEHNTTHYHYHRHERV